MQEKVKHLQAAVDDRAKQLKQVTEELNVIVRKALEESHEATGQDGGKSAGAQASSSSAAPWSTLATAVNGLVGQPGVPQEVASLLAQLQQFATAFTVGSTSTRGRPGHDVTPPAGAAAAAPGTPTDTMPKAKATATPIVLAPHGRFGKAAAAARAPQPPPPNPQPPTPQAGADGNKDNEDGGDASGGTEGAGASYASAAGAGPAEENPGERNDRGGSDSEAELVDDVADEGGPAAMDVEESIAKLPDQDQRKIRAAIRRGAARTQRKGDDEGDAEAEDGGRRERERSPRPTKVGDKDL